MKRISLRPRTGLLSPLLLLALVGCCGGSGGPERPLEPPRSVVEPQPAPAHRLVPGEYGPLRIAHDPASGAVTGYYESMTGWDEEIQAPRFSCVFALHGTLEGNRAAIATAYPGDGEVITGILELTGEQALRITLDEEHGGCWNVQPDFPRPQGGVAFSLGAEQPWTALRVVGTERAHFHDAADPDRRRKAYCVEHDVLPVLSSSPGWVEGRFEHEGNVTEGWVREADLYALPVLPEPT